jgi:tetratricopeptide (TPR) repeat protein
MKNSVVLFIFSLALALLGFNGFNAEAQKPADYDVLVSRGNSQLQSGNNEQALASAASAIKVNAGRWEAYAVAGGALLNLKRYEEAADQFSHAIDRAPEAKQEGLRTLRKQCLSAGSGASPSPPPAVPSSATTQAEIVLWKTIEHSTSIEDFQSYLRQYPSGVFAGLAHDRLENLNQLAWMDPATRLMWTKRDSGSDLTWDHALNYCSTLSLAGYNNWRLPTITELSDLYDPTVSGVWKIKGNLETHGLLWSSSASSTRQVWGTDFGTSVRMVPLRIDVQTHALCVRDR